jgi:predicted small lipoprotein YifL
MQAERAPRRGRESNGAAMFLLRPTLALILLLALLGGCGKRGPLYLPGEKNPESRTVPQESQAQEPPAAPGD